MPKIFRLSRRRLLAAGAISSAAVLTRAFPAIARPDTPLPIPRLIDAVDDRAVSLTIAAGSHAFVPGRPVESFGYSAPVLGPVIRLHRGAQTRFSIENRMQRPTTVHWHGLVIPGAVDGGPHNTIAPGKSWSVALKTDQPETTAWFHPHPHGETAPQVYAGLAGMLIVEDGSGKRMGLPNDYGVDDLPLILQDRAFDRGGTPIYAPSPMAVMAGYRGDTVIVNAAINPVARVPAGIVRLRLLNGANARIFDLRFSDGRAFHVVASDGGYLAGPVSVRNLWIAPGERYEVLVDFSGTTAVTLETGPDRNLPMMGMMGGGGIAAPGGRVLSFEVDRGKPAAVREVPQHLAEVPPLDRSKVVARRQFLLNDMMMGGMMGGPGFRRGASGAAMAINGQPFSMEAINVETALNTLEIWEIGAQSMAHPFHVHGTQFQILSLNGQTPPPHMRGWKDTVIVDRVAQILVPFSQLAARSHPFMFHCHILEHEDAGMMGQYTCT